MKIAFSESIWSRLYGPFGNSSVNTQLQALSERWDNAVAQELYWEELHHQDDIYPATFASLPWLVELSRIGGDAFKETHLFASHVIHCAFSEGDTAYDRIGSRGKFRGLSTKIEDHQHSWISNDEWVTLEDRPVLINLEQWFSTNCLVIATRCLSLVSSDPVVSTYAIEGFAAVHGSSRVACSTQMFASGEDVNFIRQELGAYDERDTSTVAKLFPYIHEKNPELASFMLDYPGCSFVPSDAKQGNLF